MRRHRAAPSALVLLTALSTFPVACGDPSASSPTGEVEDDRGGKTDIIGEDDRRDLYAWPEGSMPRVLARSTAMLMSSGQIMIEGETARIGALGALGKAKGLCDDQPFVDQPSTGFCTAFLVGPDVVVTAGHCIPERECATTSFVFGFGYEVEPADPIEALRTLPAKDVYGCKEFLFARQPSACGDADVLVVRLDRAVEDRPVLAYRRQGQLAPDTDVFMIGHPDGLPTKIATGQSRSPITDVVFKDNLDSFGGNSGSPVFDTQTGVVEGVRSCSSGEHSVPNPDDPSCKVLYQCPEDGSGCDIVLGTTYNIVDAAPILDVILGLPPLEDGGDDPDVSESASCCEAHSAASCEDAAVAACVCADDDFCCTQTWDGACVASVGQKGCGQCP